MKLDSFPLQYGITCVDTGYVRPRLAACYLLRQGDALAVIETGVNSTVAGLLELIDGMGVRRENVEYIIPTHVHLDHAGGAGRLMQALPRATLVIHPRGARHMIDPSKLSAAATAVYGEDTFKRVYGEIIPVPAERVTEAADGFSLDFHGRELLFIDTPGHARHHFCVIDHASAGIFSGDTFGLSYREFDRGGRVFGLATTTPTQFDPEALHASIERLLAFKPRRVYLTHFGCAEAVAELAGQVHADIDAFTALAKEHYTSDAAERPEQYIDRLSGAFMQYLVGRAKQTAPDMAKSEIEKLLAMDCRLNAQGVAHWALTERGKNH